MRRFAAAFFTLLVVGCGGSGDSATSPPGSGGSAGTDAGSADSAPGAPNGAACLEDAPCGSGHCVDGVCCDAACNGACQSCAIAGHEGSCTPFAVGTDPEADCAGTSGTESLCTGSCDGAGSCLFPDAQTTCGTSSCTAGTQTSMVCDGAGTCGAETMDCGLYACNPNTCNVSCSGPTDCSNQAYCASGNCEKKLANGAACGSVLECEGGFCEGGHCCGTACAAPATCETGSCSCGGKTCASGASCVVWHLDKDGDTFGAADAATDQIGCSDSPPGAAYVLDATDCYDDNVYVFPGQTQYFYAQRGDQSFDYDCDGQEAKQYATVLPSMQCIDCGFKNPISAVCDACPSFFGVTLYNMGYSCTGTPGCSGVATKEAFKAAVDCGKTGTLYQCAADSCSTAETTEPRVQGCR